MSRGEKKREGKKRENGKGAKKKDIWHCGLRTRETKKKGGRWSMSAAQKTTTAGHNTHTHTHNHTHTNIHTHIHGKTKHKEATPSDEQAIENGLLTRRVREVWTEAIELFVVLVAAYREKVWIPFAILIASKPYG